MTMEAAIGGSEVRRPALRTAARTRGALRAFADPSRSLPSTRSFRRVASRIMAASADATPAAVLGRHGGGVLGASLGASASAAVVTVQGDGVIVYDCDTQVRPRDRSRDLSAARDRPTTREPPARRAAPATPRAANSPPPPPSPPPPTTASHRTHP